MSGAATVHVCLVSEQGPANAIPLLMERPDLAWLVATGQMLDRASGLRETLGQRGLRLEVKDGAPASGLGAIRAYAGQLADELERRHGPARVVLNITGGKKLMAVGFLEAFRERFGGERLRVIYTDTELERIEQVLPADAGPVPLRNVLDAQIYLGLYGFACERARSDDPAWVERARARAELTRTLADEAQKLHPGLRVIDARMRHGQAVGLGGLPEEEMQALKRLERLCRPHGLLDRSIGRLLTVRGDEAYAYLKGGWLEEYAWLVLDALGADDCRAGVKGAWPTGEGNELDVVAIHGNRPLFVECKAVSRSSTRDMSPVLYKLDSVTGALRRGFGKAALLTVNEVTDSVRRRAEGQGIEIFDGVRLRAFEGWVASWAGRLRERCR